MGAKARLAGGPIEKTGEMRVVSLREIHKTGQARYRGATQRIYPHEINVVSQYHEMAGSILAVYSASGIGEEQIANSKGSKRTDCKGDSIQIVALVKVNPAAEDEHRDITGPGGNEFAGVAWNTGTRETGNFRIRNASIHRQVAKHMIEAAAQDHSQGWTKHRDLAYFVGGMFRPARLGSAYWDS